MGTKTRKTVFLTEVPSNSEHTSSLLAKHLQSTGVPSTIGGGHLSNVREKIITARSEGDTAQILGFLIIAGSVMMFVFMIISGFIWALSQMGPGLGAQAGVVAIHVKLGVLLLNSACGLHSCFSHVV